MLIFRGGLFTPCLWSCWSHVSFHLVYSAPFAEGIAEFAKQLGNCAVDTWGDLRELDRELRGRCSLRTLPEVKPQAAVDGGNFRAPQHGGAAALTARPWALQGPKSRASGQQGASG